MGKWHKAAVVLAAAILAWLFVPEFKSFTGVAFAFAIKLLIIAALIALLWFLAPLVFWDAPRLLYRRFVAPYLRLRRMMHYREAKLLADAAARTDTRRH
jgi:hypothetical protein